MLCLSPLAVLITTLARICQHAQQHHSLLSKNEAATRAALIDPVLRALGWDTADISMVVPEYAVGNKQKPDYYLKHRSGVVQFVIEAKKLGEDLDKIGHTGKIIGYAFSLKPVAHFVTDGLNWHCYLPSHSQYEPSVTFKIESKNLLLAAQQLVQLLDATQGSHGLPTNKQINADSVVNLTENEFVINKQLSNSIDKPLAKQYRPLAIELVKTEVGKPIWLQLPDGTEHKIKIWKEILVKTCELVLFLKPHLPIPLPDKAGKKTALLSWSPPKKGLSFHQLTYQSKLVFLYTNYDATGCIANALYLAQQLPKKDYNAAIAVAF